MTNHFLKGAHLSDRKFRELLQLFSEDLTATQIANITKLSRVTINYYLKKIRNLMAVYCEQQHPMAMPPDGTRPLGFRFGIIRSGALFITIPLPDAEGEAAANEFVAIADFKNWRLMRPTAHLDNNGRSVMDEVSGFWGQTKNRLQKFRGLHPAAVYLHVKESEFRYNARQLNLHELLLQLVLKN
jgi:transposase